VSVLVAGAVDTSVPRKQNYRKAVPPPRLLADFKGVHKSRYVEHAKMLIARDEIYRGCEPETVARRLREAKKCQREANVACCNIFETSVNLIGGRSPSNSRTGAHCYGLGLFQNSESPLFILFRNKWTNSGIG
jgi:hypothetical protein